MFFFSALSAQFLADNDLQHEIAVCTLCGYFTWVSRLILMLRRFILEEKKKTLFVAAERKLFVNSELALLTSTNSVHSVF